MSVHDDARLVCVGPTGIGYYAEIQRLPQRDSGEWASSSGAMVMCDAPIVAIEAARRHNVCLITNNLGGSIESSMLRKHVLDLGISLLEDPMPVSGVPFDMLMLERQSGTRSFVTTDYSPRPAHIRQALSEMSQKLNRDEGRTFLYMDAELSSPDAHETVVILNSLAFTPTLALINLDDVSDFSAALRWIRDQDVHLPTVFQISYKGEIGYGPDLHSLWDSGHTVIVTSGASGAHLLSPGSVQHIRCDEVKNALTVGAGAILSGALMSGAMSASLDVVTEPVLTAAMREASSFVRHFSEGTYREDVFLW